MKSTHFSPWILGRKRIGRRRRRGELVGCEGEWETWVREKGNVGVKAGWGRKRGNRGKKKNKGERERKGKVKEMYLWSFIGT